MDGVILFVDDKAHEVGIVENDVRRSAENELFESLRKDYPVLAVRNLDLAKRAIRSIGSFSAIILDWIFDDRQELLNPGEENEEIRFITAGAVQDDRTLVFLEENDFYSLVYIYSDVDVEGKYGERLTQRFGDRIQFHKKALDNPAETIANRIREWRDQNKNLSIPLAWTATINQSIQQIFKELADADVNWLRDIAQSAKEDGVSEDLFIIEIFQHLLAETNIRNEELRKAITEYLESATVAEMQTTNDGSIARLFNRLFYTRISNDVPIMTGDICEIDEQAHKYGIIVSPECDIKRILSKKTGTFEMLVFEADGFYKYIEKKFQGFTRVAYTAWQTGNKQEQKKVDEIRKLFNQLEPRVHILPSFPTLDSLNQSVVIEFNSGSQFHRTQDVENYKREYKLNSPFIQQLRQRYLSYLGRIGVPSLPVGVIDFNLM